MRLNDRELVMRTRLPKPGEDWFRIENHDTSGDTTHVYIYDEIGYWGTEASDFIQQFKDITTPKITVHINSPGGRIFDGIAIYNAMKQHPSAVTTQVDALAASAASFIAQAGDTRVMTKNATMMIHDGAGIVMGNSQDMRDMADLLDKMSNNIASIYAEAAGGSATDWRALMVEETWYDAQEALDSGLADSILPTEDKKAEEATNRWDLSIFAHAGRENAPSPREIREKITLLHNRATKEAPVGKPTNQNQDPEEAPGTGQPGGTEGDDPTKGTQQQPGPEGTPAEEPTQPPGTKQPEPQPENKGLVNLSVGGTNFQVPALVAQHISTLENFRDETVKSGRKNFVASLAAGPKPKVVASQIEKLEELALSLSPEQFETWKASWDAAPGHALLGNHGQGVSNAGGDADSARSKLEDELEVAREIVANHKRANMPQAQIEKTPSFQRMQELEAQLASTS
jgi:ATP-dependent protease ClpP protease subunit